MSLGFLGGMDPTGGAGVLRDASTARAIAPAAPIACVVTSLTAQGGGVRAHSYPVDAGSFAARLTHVDTVKVLKVGVVPTSLGEVLRAWLSQRVVPVIIDPVLCASDGGALGGSVGTYIGCCGAQTLLTPNVEEARHIVGDPSLVGEALACAVAEVTGAGAVLLKGGHAAVTTSIVDIFWDPRGVERIARPRIEGPDIRGTGCALGAAIASRLWLGDTIREAVDAAVRWLDAARRSTHPGPDGRFHLSLR